MIFDLLFQLQNLWMAALAGLVMLILSNQWDARTLGQAQFGQRILRNAAWTSIVIGIVGWWIGVTGLLALVVVPLIFLLVFGYSWYWHRLAENQALVNVLMVGMEKGIPPVTSAVAYHQEAVGMQRDRAMRLAKAVGQGIPLTDAARQVGLAIPAETRMTLELERKFGRSEQLRAGGSLTQKDAGYGVGQIDAVVASLLILVATCLFMGGILTFVMIKIVPTLKEILEEFGMSYEGSAFLWTTMQNSATIVSSLLVIILPAAFALLVLIVLVQFGWLNEMPFGLRWLHGPLSEIRLLNSLSRTVAANIPIAEAVELIESRFPGWRIRRRLREARQRMQEGGDWIEQLTIGGVLNIGEAALARSAQTAGNLAWALREIAIGKQRRHAHRIGPLFKMIVPFLVLLTAIPVLALALGVFVPLIQMISLLS